MAYSIAYIKQRTLEIYDSLPQDKEQRKNCIKERDEIIELNYKFFGYVASHTFINNSSIEYEDKFQSCISHFLECWWWYKWKGDETHKGYRQDLSFAVFFKPRLGEMIERELNEVKYSIRRSLCIEAGDQLNKHWAKVTYDDLKNVKLPVDKMNSLKAIFGSLYIADLSDYQLYLDKDISSSLFNVDISENYDIEIEEHFYPEYGTQLTESDRFAFINIQDTDKQLSIKTQSVKHVEKLLMHDMYYIQKKLDDSELLLMSDMYGIHISILKESLPEAEKRLISLVEDKLDMLEGFK